MAIKKTNHNYMAIPRFPRELSSTTGETFSASNYRDSYGNVDNWYGFRVAEDDTVIASVEYDGYTVDYSDRTFEKGEIILGNIKSITITSGKIDAQTH